MDFSSLRLCTRHFSVHTMRQCYFVFLHAFCLKPHMLLSSVKHTNNYHDGWWWSKKGETVKRNHLSAEFSFLFPIFSIAKNIRLRVDEMFAPDGWCRIQRNGTIPNRKKMTCVKLEWMVKRRSHFSLLSWEFIATKQCAIEEKSTKNLSNAWKCVANIRKEVEKSTLGSPSLSILMRLMNGEMDLPVGSYISCTHISQYILNWEHFSRFRMQHATDQLK